MFRFFGSRPLVLGLALLVAGFFSLSLAARPAEAATGPDYYGATIQPMFGAVSSDRWPTFLAAMSSDGLRDARLVAPWKDLEPYAPSSTGKHFYDWKASLDALVTQLAQKGLRMNPVLGTAPTWAGDANVSLTPAHYPDLAAFAKAFAGRYGTGGAFWAAHPELPNLPVHNYELWTEANSTNFWTHNRNATEYVHALKLLTPAVHAADPQGRVLASIGWQDSTNYIDQMYAAGGKGTFDAVGFHPYAPFAAAIVDLVRGLRATLVRQGDGALPIFLTETGQPRSPTSPGATNGDSGLVSDEARAASQSLTGDALAHSDCDVRNDILYGTVGSETSREPIFEGYMGIYRVADAQPNATGAAIRDAQARWRADMRQSLVLCTPGSTAPENLLPLGLGLDHNYPTCVDGRTTYFGNPLEGSQLTLTTTDGRSFAQRTNAFGAARVCIPDGPPVTHFEVHSEVANIATSPTYICPTADGPCGFTLPAAPAPPPPAEVAPVIEVKSAVVARRCRYVLSLKILKRTHRKALVRGVMSCGNKVGKPATLKFNVSTKKRKARKRVSRRHVTLRGTKRLTFTVKVRLSRGDRVYLIHRRDVKRGTPEMVKHVTVPKPKKHKAQHPKKQA
jgi:hypothetical protein